MHVDMERIASPSSVSPWKLGDIGGIADCVIYYLMTRFLHTTLRSSATQARRITVALT